MIASKFKVPLVLNFAALFVSFLVLMAAVKGDSVLRIVLASVGVVGFGGLYVALLIASKRTPSP